MTAIGKDALLEFGRVLDEAAASRDDVDYQVGLNWSHDTKWMVYFSCGTKALKMRSAGARSMAKSYRASAKKAGINDPMIMQLIDSLESCASEADGKNARREVPAGAAILLPAEGTA